MSSFRLGVLTGGLVGYVLGAKAGRRRYEQLSAVARSAGRSRPAQQIGTEVRGIADRGRDLIGEKAAQSVTRVTSAVRGVTSSGGADDGAGDGDGDHGTASH